MTIDEQETTTVDEQPAPDPRPGDLFATFWVAAWAGTATAGGLFGLLLVGYGFCAFGFVAETLPAFIIAPIFGAAYAGVLAIPIHVTIAILTWAFWLKRFRLAAAAIAGAVTGVVATFFVEPGAGVVTGPLGAIGAAVFGYQYTKRKAAHGPTPVASEKAIWQFTIRDLLVRMTVLAMLASAWTWYFKTTWKAEERRRQEYQEIMAEMEAEQVVDAPLEEATELETPDASEP